MFLKRYYIWDSGASFEKIPHLSIFPSQGSQQKHCINYRRSPITAAATPPLDRSGPDAVEMKSLKGGGGGGAENKDGKKKAFKNGLVLISLPEENRGFRQARKNSHVEHCLVSKTVVQNTIKMKFLLPEKTSYLAIAKDTRCNDW